MKILFHGHSCFSISNKGYNVLVDPFLSGNPHAKVSPLEIETDAILVSHGHGDHLGDAIDISKKNNAPIIAPYELAMYCQKKGAKVHPMHIGGAHNFEFGSVKLTPALHGSALVTDDEIQYTGNPCGFLITIDGKTIYHAGDTGLFKDMELIGILNNIEVALLPIGDNFTMGINDAVEAVKMLKPKLSIPMHYNTFELIKQNPLTFAKKIEKLGFNCKILDIENEINI